MVRKAIIGLVLGVFALNVAACNTVKGAGKDVESVGQAGDDAINGK